MGNVMKIVAALLVAGGVAGYLFLRGPSSPPVPPDPEGGNSPAVHEPRSDRTQPPGVDQVPTEPRPELRVAVEGTVIDEAGQTYPGTEVSLQRGFGDSGTRSWTAEANAFTDNDGRFRFEELATGTYRFRSIVPGRAVAEATQFIDANATPPEIRLVLLPGVTIEGTVRDGFGAPIADARVLALDERGTESDSPTDVILRLLELEDMQTDPGTETRTASDGTYSIEGLDPEKRYRVRASAPTFAGQEKRYIPAGSVEIDYALGSGGTFTGTVTCDGEVVAGAEISVRRELAPESEDAISAIEKIQEYALPPIASARTVEDGTYRLDSLDGNVSYFAEIRAPGHRLARFDALTVEEGQVLEVPFEIEKGLVIEGIVTDPEGTPLPSATCRIQPVGATGILGPFAGNTPEDSHLTDETGRFRADTLTDTTYTVSVSHPEFASHLSRNVIPGGEPLAIELPLGAAVSGRIVDAVDETPLVGAEVSTPDVAGTSRRALTNENGEYELRGLTLPRGGAVVLNASAEGYEPEVGRRVNAQLGLTRTGTDFTLRRNGWIEGVVIDFDRRPLAGVTVVAIRPNPMNGGVATVSARVRTNERGIFRLDDVTPGTGTIVRGNHTAYIESFTEPFVVESDRKSGGVELLMRIGGDVLGRVVDDDGTPISNAVVGLRDDRLGIEDPSLMPIHTTTGPEGHYVLRRIPAGEITLIATAPDFLGSQLSGVEVQEGHRIEGIDLHLSRGARVTGYVRDIYGDGIDGASVTVIDTSFGLKKFTEKTDGKGYFSFTKLGPYPVDVEATAKHHGKERITQHPVNKGDVTIVLQAFGGIRGRVETIDGSPVESYNVSPRRVEENGRVLPRVASRTFRSPTFDFGGLVPGTYQIIVGAKGHAPAVHEGIVIRQKRFTELPVSQLDSGGVIAGSVYEAESGYALPDAKLFLVGGEENFHADGTTGPPPRPGARRSGFEVGEDGAFRISGLFYDIVTIRVEAPGMITKVLDVNAGNEQLLIGMQAGGEISGIVYGPGDTLVGSQQVHLSGGPPGAEQRTATTDRRGQFGFTGLIPGRYTLRVSSLSRQELEKGDKNRKVQTQIIEVTAGELLEVELYYD